MFLKLNEFQYTHLPVQGVDEEAVPRLRVVPLEVLARAGEVHALHADVHPGRGQGAGRARQRLGGHPAAGRGRRGHLWLPRFTRWKRVQNAILRFS